MVVYGSSSERVRRYEGRVTGDRTGTHESGRFTEAAGSHMRTVEALRRGRHWVGCSTDNLYHSSPNDLPVTDSGSSPGWMSRPIESRRRSFRTHYDTVLGPSVAE